MSKDRTKVIARNKKARHDYELLDRYEAGMVLTGSEVKVLRNGKGSIAQAYIKIKGGEAWLLRANLPIYEQASYNNHEADRPRKLLLNKKELKKLNVAIQQKGLTMVPLTLMFRGPWVKLEFALARGRKKGDRREALKAKAHNRDKSLGKRG
ncbi:MAG TPA: SsrA-binding protein SmpB [Myxococcota bacterium]|nr:SsrA-binding protein SmpB [Myxococcota bacterium]